MNKNLNYILEIYIPETDSVLVNLSNNITIELSCKKCHSNLVAEFNETIIQKERWKYHYQVIFPALQYLNKILCFYFTLETFFLK